MYGKQKLKDMLFDDLGPDYLKRVCKEKSGAEAVKILSVSEVIAYLLEDKEVNSWMAGVKEYLMDVNGQLITDKKLVLFPRHSSISN